MANTLFFPRSAINRLLAANGALGLAVLSAALTAEARYFMTAHPFVFLVSLILIEIVVIVSLWGMHRTGEDDVFSGAGDELSREKMTIRFGTSGDDWGTERVYGEWFSSKLSIDDDDYCKIMARGKFIRVAEVTASDGAQTITRIAGYYAVFPMASETFSALCDGTLRERDLKSAMVLDPDDPNAMVLYICEIVSSKTCDVRVPLVGDLRSYVLHAVAANGSIARIGTWPYTKYGKRLVRSLEMRPIGRRLLFKKFYQLPRARLVGVKGRPFRSSHTTHY